MWSLNCKLVFQTTAPKLGEEPRKYPAVKSRGVSAQQGEMAGDTESLLKSQCTKFHFQPLTLHSSSGREERTGDLRGKSVTDVSESKLKGLPP